MSKPSVSAVIIAYNEEANIRRCLDSVRWADEIIVVDSGSADNTIGICEEYGCRVFNHEWEGYARQKSFAVGLATSDWVLSIDADEEVTPELMAEIGSVINSGSPDPAYTMPRRNFFLGKPMGHGGWYPDRQLRLFKRGAGTFTDVPLHERLILHDPSGRIGALRNPLMHYTYVSVSDFIRRADSYTDIEVGAMLAEGRMPKRPLLKLMTAFPLKFAETYIYKAGWRDGIHGLIAATLVSTRVFMRYAKVWHRSMME